MAKKERVKKARKGKFKMPEPVIAPVVKEKILAKPPMTYAKYEEIISKGKRIDWYDTKAPQELCTPEVHYMANMVKSQIDKLVAEDLLSTANYREDLLNNIRLMPYTLNSDTYLVKKREIEKRYKIKDTSIGPPPVIKTLSKKEQREENKKKAALKESEFDAIDAAINKKQQGQKGLTKEERKARKLARIANKLK